MSKIFNEISKIANTLRETNLYLELVRDWETPLTKFHKGHINNAETWANILGISKAEFNDSLLGGCFEEWFKPCDVPTEGN